MKILFASLGSNNGCPALALPALGSFLWDLGASTPDIKDARLSNRHLLAAFRALATTRSERERIRRVVDYRNLGAEELGSVYESLLELHPAINVDARSFTLDTSAGNDRKTSGSYYTADSLVQCLLDTALDPVIKARLDEARRLARSDVASRIRDERHRQLSGSQSVAKGDGSGGGELPPDKELSKRGTLRDDQSNSQSELFDSSEHRGGLGTGRNQGVHPIPEDRSGQPEGSRDTPIAQSASGASDSRPDPADAESGNRDRQNDPLPDWFFAAQAEGLDSLPTFLSRYSLLAEKALLSLRVCDPAVGSGHFLIAAAHRLARALASVRSGEDEPTPHDYQHALRDVVGRCLYGVDINPMAVELCKVSLWIEALEPGKPLSFLDHHIRCGNSLLGTTPALIEKGIPDGAYKALTGDNAKACTFLKSRNKGEREGIGGLFVAEDTANLDALRTAAESVESIAADSITALQRKEQEYHKAETSYERLKQKQIADLWCAAFVWEKKVLEENAEEKCTKATGVTTGHLQQLAKDSTLADDQLEHLGQLTDDYQFFHWHVEFPGVFRIPRTGEAPENTGSGLSGGFDALIGNPPWERIQIKDTEWFAIRLPEILEEKTAAGRRKRIAELASSADPGRRQIHLEFLRDHRFAEGQRSVIRESGRFPLCGVGELNTYAIFTELSSHQVRRGSRVGMIVPTGIITDDTYKKFFSSLVKTSSLAAAYDCENMLPLFPEVKRTMRFCMLTFEQNPIEPLTARFAFFIHQVSDLTDTSRVFTLSDSDIGALNPNTKTCPVFRRSTDAELTKAAYRWNPVLEVVDGNAKSNPWNVRLTTLYHTSSASSEFRTFSELEEKTSLVGNFLLGDEGDYAPLYEQNLISFYDHRFATYRTPS